MDPKLWVNPEEFNPKRFIDSDGKVKKPEFFMPFGVGRRMCKFLYLSLLICISFSKKLWLHNKNDLSHLESWLFTESKFFFLSFHLVGLGDVLAKMEIFLFFATIAHSFDIELAPGAEMPSLKGNVGVTITPSSFDVCLKPRPLNLEPGMASAHCRNVGSS